VLAGALGIACRVERTNAVALTFDDGPHPEGTPATLELLDSYKTRATFFLVGEQVERFPRIAAEIVRRGHEVALHGHEHKLLLRRSPASLARELEQADALIGEATGQRPVFYRPPYGIFSAGALPIVRRGGWKPMLWSRWGRDWSGSESPESIAGRAVAGLRPGDVVLLHDADHYSVSGSWRMTVAALPLILEEIVELGVPSATLSDST